LFLYRFFTSYPPSSLSLSLSLSLSEPQFDVPKVHLSATFRAFSVFWVSILRVISGSREFIWDRLMGRKESRVFGIGKV
jgi:hypothetical protein